MNKILNGIRVLDMGTHVAVPLAGKLMAELGADVIKVEPLNGEAWRINGRIWGLPCQDDNNPLMQPGNSNKRSVSFNLKDENGRAALLKLMETADVFLTNTRLAGLKRLGLDYETVKEKFPRLIYVHLSGYGIDGPDAARPGYDVLAYWSASGALTHWPYKENAPVKPVPGMGDGTTGAMIATGVLAALYNREKTGIGEFIQTSLFACGLWYNSNSVIMGQPQFKEWGHVYPKSMYELEDAFAPLYQTKDGDWFMICDYWDKKYKVMLDILGKPEYKGNPHWEDQINSRKYQREIIPVMQEGFANCTTEYLIKECTENDVAFAKLANPSELYCSEQAWANGYLKKINLENGEELIIPVLPLKFHNCEQDDSFSLAPQVGEHTTEILTAAGIPAEEVQKMIDEGAVRQYDMSSLHKE